MRGVEAFGNHAAPRDFPRAVDLLLANGGQLVLADLRRVPQLVGDDAKLGDFRAYPFALGVEAQNAAASVGVLRLALPVPADDADGAPGKLYAAGTNELRSLRKQLGMATDDLELLPRRKSRFGLKIYAPFGTVIFALLFVAWGSFIVGLQRARMETMRTACEANTRLMTAVDQRADAQYRRLDAQNCNLDDIQAMLNAPNRNALTHSKSNLLTANRLASRQINENGV